MNYDYWHRLTRQMLFAIYIASMVMIVAGADMLAILVTDIACCLAVLLLSVVIVSIARRRHRKKSR